MSSAPHWSSAAAPWAKKGAPKVVAVTCTMLRRLGRWSRSDVQAATQATPISTAHVAPVTINVPGGPAIRPMRATDR